MPRYPSVFLTGATGFLGRAVLKVVAAGGRRVTALARPKARERGTAALWVEGSVWEPGRWMEALRGQDAVVHLAGGMLSRGEETLERVHVQGTELVVEAANSAGVKKIVLLSCLGAAPDAASSLRQAKWKAEQLVRWAGPAFTILRPSFLFGPGGGLAALLKRVSDSSLGRSFDNAIQPVFVEDVARCVLRCLDDKATDGKEFDLPGPHRLKVEEAMEALGLRSKGLALPMGLARVQAAVLGAVLGRATLSEEELSLFEENSVGDPAAATAAFGGSWTSFRDWCRGGRGV